MTNKPIYTPEELRGKYISYFKTLTGGQPARDCVRYGSGPREGLPYLYNSLDEAKTDQYFDPEWDEVIEASDYFTLYAQIKTDAQN